MEDENCCPSYDIDWLSGIWGVCWACRCYKHLILLQHPFTVQCMDHMRIPMGGESCHEIESHASMLGSTRVCDRAAGSRQEYGITSNELRSMVANGNISLSGASTDSKTYGAKLTLVVNVGTSEYVVDVANAMAKAFADEINDLLGVSTLQVMDEAVEYTAHHSINLTLYFILFGAVAFVGTAGIIFIKEFFSSKGIQCGTM